MTPMPVPLSRLSGMIASTPTWNSFRPDHAGIDRAGRHETVADIVGDWRRELRFDDRNEMIDEVGELKVLDLGFQVAHAVLHRPAVGEHLRHVDIFVDKMRPGRDLIADLSSDRDRPCPSHRFGKPAEPLAERVGRGECAVGVGYSGMNGAGATPLDDQAEQHRRLYASGP